MKKFIYFALLCAFCACDNKPKNANSPSVESETPQVVKYRMMGVVESIYSTSPNKADNDIQKNKFATKIFSAIDDSLKINNEFLADVPLKYMAMMQKDQTHYILKFEGGEHTSDDPNLIMNNEADVSIGVFAVVPTEFAETIKDGALYYVKGEYRGKAEKLRLPSGAPCSYNATYFNFSDGEESICAGGFYFENIELTPAE